MNDQIKESTNEVTKDIPISQLDPMLKLEISREVVQQLSRQVNNWLSLKPVECKGYQDDVKALWKTLEIMEQCEFLFKEEDEKAEDNAA